MKCKSLLLVGIGLLFSLGSASNADDDALTPDEFGASIVLNPSVLAFSKGTQTDLGRSNREMEDNYDQQTEQLTKFLKVKDESALGDLRKAVAIHLLGELRASCAADALAANLMYKPQKDYFGYTMVPPQFDYPAAVALVSIGNPSILPVIRRAAFAPSKNERQLAAWVLLRIDGKEISLTRLQLFKGSLHGRDAENIDDALKYIQSSPSASFLENIVGTVK